MPQSPKTHRPFADRRADEQAQAATAYETRRGDATKRGYGHKWRQARAAFLRRNPLCVMCEAEGLVAEARVVDHIVPHRGDDALFWDRKNWQPLCKSHHSTKTAAHDGGFRNPRHDGDGA